MEESSIKPTVAKENEFNLEVSETYDYTVWFIEKCCIFIGRPVSKLNLPS